MIYCYIIRTNRTMALKRVHEKKDDFKFEGGTYYIKPDKIILQKMVAMHRPMLIYIENYAEPIGIGSIEKKKVTGDETILIDAKSIHNLTSRKLLSVLAGDKLTGRELFIIVLLIINFIATVSLHGVLAGG